MNKDNKLFIAFPFDKKKDLNLIDYPGPFVYPGLGLEQKIGLTHLKTEINQRIKNENIILR